MPKFEKGETERPAQGRARMAELAEELRNEVQGVVVAMCRGLGREPTKYEKLTAQSIAACHLKAARMRDKGQNELELEYLRMACELTSNSVFRLPMDKSPRAEIELAPSAAD
jgi:hypothetical protein